MNYKQENPFEFKIMRVRECPFPTMEMSTAVQVVEYWRANIPQADWYDENKEALIVLVLNKRRHVLGHNLVALGSIDTINVHPREVFKPVICMSGAACILAHNHPSGDPSPSESDIHVTRELIRAGQLLQIELIDHVIIGASSGHRSLRELGYFYAG